MLRCAEFVVLNGTTATFIDRGAIFTQLLVADRNGVLDDVVLGFDHPGDYSGRTLVKIVDAGHSSRAP